MVSSQTLPRSTLPDGYPQLLARLKREIGAARTRAALAVNEELIKLYWSIGFSYTNLKYMRQFAACWPDGEIGPQAVGQLP
jgi:hypothetical protein